MTKLLQRLNVRWDRSDAVRLLLSLFIAMLLWGWVTDSRDPETTRFFAGVPISVGELSAPLAVVSSIPDVSVTVTGPRSVVAELVASDLNASLQLDGIEAAGAYTQELRVESPRGVFSTTITPSRLPIRVEEVITERYVIEAAIQGNQDSTRQVSASIVNASEITAVGPRSAIDRIASVVAPVVIENQTRDFTSSVAPVALDSQGQPIPEVRLTPDIVTVNVAILARGQRVVVLTQLVGEPAQGYEVIDRTSNPPTVLVDGPEDLIASLISVTTEPVDITGAVETLTERATLTGLPEGVSVIDPADQTVDVIIQIRQLGVSQPLVAQTVQVMGLAPGLTASVAPDGVSVTVVASEEIIGALTANDLTIQVNLAGLGPGAHVLTPVVALPPNVTWLSSEPATVMVTITETVVIPAPQGSPSPVS